MEYLFVENTVFNKELQFVFLCGSHFHPDTKDDKRIVMKEFISSCNADFHSCLRPIILEESFMFRSSNSKMLLYDDINLRNLYQVEALVNYLADNTIIIHESISTGAEAGLFISNPLSWNRTCLIIPDKISVEEDRLGKFLELAIKNMDPALTVIRFSPSIKRHYISNDLSQWHTYFYDNEIGENLGKALKTFLSDNSGHYPLSFTSVYGHAREQNLIHYRINEKKQLVIDILPRTLFSCIMSILSIDELRDYCFGNGDIGIDEVVNRINAKLKKVFVNTIEEKGYQIEACSIRPRMTVNDIRVTNIIGMSLYLLHAAGLIEIKKVDDKVNITRKMIKIDGKNYFFYDFYCSGIKRVTKNVIV